MCFYCFHMLKLLFILMSINGESKHAERTVEELIGNYHFKYAFNSPKCFNLLK